MNAALKNWRHIGGAAVFNPNKCDMESLFRYIASERMHRRYQICIARCLYSYRDDFPETLGKTTAPECKKSTWSSSLKNRTPFNDVN